MDGTCEVRFTRYYDAAPEDVWAALTERASVTRWLTHGAGIDLAGDAFELRLADGGAVTARVRALEPARLLELDWVDGVGEPSVVRLELARDGDGTVLVLDHRRVDARVGMVYIARWERHLRRLDSLVA